MITDWQLRKDSKPAEAAGTVTVYSGKQQRQEQNSFKERIQLKELQHDATGMSLSNRQSRSWVSTTKKIKNHPKAVTSLQKVFLNIGRKILQVPQHGLYKRRSNTHKPPRLRRPPVCLAGSFYTCGEGAAASLQNELINGNFLIPLKEECIRKAKILINTCIFAKPGNSEQAKSKTDSIQSPDK